MTSAPCDEFLDRPLIDVRSPAEFARGALPHAVNLPILDDPERREVGITYKAQGQDAAIDLGMRLVTGERRQLRIAAWQRFAADRPEAALYCARGGLRSQIACEWLASAGTPLPRVAGGFKRLRRYCLELLDQAAASAQRWVVVGGRTGTGKTHVVNAFASAIDLEGVANHRGSAFGAMAGGQPPPVGFENHLAAAWHRLQRARTATEPLVLEDEGPTIGRLAVPAVWHARMQRSDIVQVEARFAERVAHVHAEYVTEPLAQGTRREALLARYAEALDRIRRRLGGAEHAATRRQLEAALGTDGSPSDSSWIANLLSRYYDPMYDHQLAGKRERIRFRGTREEVRAYLAEQGAIRAG